MWRRWDSPKTEKRDIQIFSIVATYVLNYKGNNRYPVSHEGDGSLTSRDSAGLGNVTDQIDVIGTQTRETRYSYNDLGQQRLRDIQA